MIDVQTQQKKKVKDSLAAAKFLDSLSQSNYFFTDLKGVNEVDNKIEISYDKGKNFNEAFVSLNDTVIADIKSTQKEFFTKNLDSVKKDINKKFIDQGFSFSRVKSNIKVKKKVFLL